MKLPTILLLLLISFTSFAENSNKIKVQVQVQIANFNDGVIRPYKNSLKFLLPEQFSKNSYDHEISFMSEKEDTLFLEEDKIVLRTKKSKKIILGTVDLAQADDRYDIPYPIPPHNGFGVRFTDVTLNSNLLISYIEKEIKKSLCTPFWDEELEGDENQIYWLRKVRKNSIYLSAKKTKIELKEYNRDVFRTLKNCTNLQNSIDTFTY